MVNDLLTRVKDIFQKLRSKLSALLNTPEPPQPSEKAPRKVSSSYGNPKALLLKRAASAKRAKAKAKHKSTK